MAGHSSSDCCLEAVQSCQPLGFQNSKAALNRQRVEHKLRYVLMQDW